MGRPELPLDPAAGPVAAFACDLRALRERSGGPSYRVLARRTHYSVTTLSQAAAGKVLPTLPVLTAFVAGCSGDVAGWQDRWRALASDLNATAPLDHGIAEPDRAPDPGPSSWLRGSQRSRIRTVLPVVIVLAAAAGISLTVMGSRTPTPATGSRTPSPAHVFGAADPIADGSDPGRAGCGPDAVTLLSTKVIFRGQDAGVLELRYSPHCQAAWSRFTPEAGWSPGPGVVVTVWTIRPADDATQTYAVPYGGEAIIGNMLMTAKGCVLAEVSMKQGKVNSPFAVTACQVVRPAHSSASAAPSG